MKDTQKTKQQLIEEISRLREVLDQSLEQGSSAGSGSESEDFQKYLEYAPYSIVMINNEGEIVLVNSMAEKVFGYTREEIIMKPLEMLIPERFHEIHRKHRKQFYASPRKRPMGNGLDLHARRKDGSEFPVDINLSPVGGDDNHLTMSIIVDITERKKIENALKENLSQLSKQALYNKIIGTVTRSVHQSLNLQEVLENAIQTVSENMESVECVAIYLVEGEEAVLRAYRGYPQWFVEKTGRIQSPKGVTWKTIIEGKYQYSPDTDKDELLGPAGKELGTKSYLSMPIKYEGMTVGCININSQKTHAYDEDELKLLEIIAQQIESAISNARKAEKIIESEKRLQRYLEYAPYSIVMVNGKGEIVLINSMAEKQFGYNRDEMLNQSIEMLIPDRSRGMHTKERESYSEKPRTRTMGTGLNLYAKRKDGSEFPVDISLSPVGTEDNKLVMSILIDITERKRMEDMLAEEKERLDVTLRSIGDGVITTDTETNIVLMNKVAEQLTGWSTEDANGRPLSEVFHIINANTREVCDNPAHKALRENKIVGLSNHTVLISKDGTEVVLADSAAPIRDKDNKTIGVVLVFRDVTDRHKMEEALATVEKLQSLGVLAGGIAHDFNNLLTGILGNVSLAKMTADPKDEVYIILSKAEKASLQAKELTQQLLTFAKGGAPVKKTVSINELLDECIGFSLRSSNVTFKTYIPDDLMLVEVDPGQINQVINNLIINADQATPGGGAVEIICENLTVKPDSALPLNKGRYVKISIKDYGIGIPEEYIDKIFDPYFTTKQKGSGLGLSTTFSIVKNHGGHITVQSEQGMGSTFNIYIPASDQTTTQKLEDMTDGIMIGKGKVLVMDDEEMISDMALRGLKSIGYEVDVAKDGVEAIELYNTARKKEIPYDAVILDLTVPGSMGGKETIQKLMETDPHIKAIVSSGYSDDPVMADFKKHGFRGCITKPYKIQELSKILYNVITSLPNK